MKCERRGTEGLGAGILSGVYFRQWLVDSEPMDQSSEEHSFWRAIVAGSRLLNSFSQAERAGAKSKCCGSKWATSNA